MATSESQRLERRERRLLRLSAVAPYVLLGTATILSMLTGDEAPGERIVTLWLVVLSAVWLWIGQRWAVPPRADLRPVPAAVYVAGLVVLIAALGIRDAWFAGFFGFVGYLHAWRYLPGWWRFVGVTATAAISVTSFMGGPPEPTPAGVAGSLFFIGAIVAAVALFSSIGDATVQHSAERERMVRRLEESIRENEGLQAQLLVQAREAGMLDERQRIAREIHDTIAQGLAGIVTQLQAAERAHGNGVEEQWRRHHDHAVRLARESLAEARRSVHAVGPAELESARLPDAVAAVAADWGRLTGTPVEATTTGEGRRLHPELEVTLLRVAQEALANAGKHARASRVGVTLSYMDDVVTLDVRDDGVGFDPARVADGGGFGLTSMRQRMDRVGGVLEIESEPGAGVAISATVPAVPAEPLTSGAPTPPPTPERPA